MVVVSGVRRNDCKQELRKRINLNDNDDGEDDDAVKPLHNGPVGDRGKCPL